jgi:hypothetical protein
MKTIIAGSRTIIDRESVFKILDELEFSITEVVCGMASGVDFLGKEWACSKGIFVKEFPADWKAHKLKAGPIRNQQMSDYADTLVLIWDGQSSGSADMLKRAKRDRLKIDQYVLTENRLF